MRDSLVGLDYDFVFNRANGNIGDQHAKGISRGCPSATRFERI